jgi:hypothetical protein
MKGKKHTIRKNQFDKKYVRQTPLYIDNDGVEHSLNKYNNWKLLESSQIEQIKCHRDVISDIETISLTNHIPNSYGGGSTGKYKKGRDFVTIDGKNQNADFKIQDHKNCIILPFHENEYPINREPHINYEQHCKTCFMITP